MKTDAGFLLDDDQLPQVKGQPRLYLHTASLAVVHLQPPQTLQSVHGSGRFLEGLESVCLCVYVCVCEDGNGVGPLLFWQKVANGSRSKKTDRSSKMVAKALRWLPDTRTHTHMVHADECWCVWQKMSARVCWQQLLGSGGWLGVQQRRRLKGFSFSLY